MSRQAFQQEKPPVASLDFNEHLRNAYFNAENSLNLFQTEGGSLIPGYPEGGSGFKAKVAWDKFVGEVKILVAMIKGTPSLKDDLPLKQVLEEADGKKVQVDNPDYYGSSSQPKTITKTVREDAETIALKVFAAVTELFHRKGIFKPAVVVYGGHL